MSKSGNKPLCTLINDKTLRYNVYQKLKYFLSKPVKSVSLENYNNNTQLSKFLQQKYLFKSKINKVKYLTNKTFLPSNAYM